MVTAMERASPEPVIIEDLVKFGEDRGLLRHARSTLRRALARRQIALTPEAEARIDACMDVDTLERWFGQAIDAATADEALQ